jgi:iron complex outermembrane receptor protein
VALGAITQDQADLLRGGMSQNTLIATQGASQSRVGLRKSWTDTSPRLVLDHRYNRELMVYASLTRGYQAGGFNSLQVASSYEPERVTNVELGLKGQLPGQGLSWNAALFQYRFDNLQTLQLVPANTPGGIPAYQVTISNQRGTGLDLEARWQLSSGLRLNGVLELLDQTYRNGLGSAGESLAGMPVGTPRRRASAGVDYDFAAFGGKAATSLQAAYQSAQRCNPESLVQGECLTTPNFRVGGPRSRLDARLGWDSANRSWGLALLVTNLQDHRYVHKLWYEAAALGSGYATLTPGRSASVELRVGY